MPAGLCTKIRRDEAGRALSPQHQPTLPLGSSPHALLRISDGGLNDRDLDQWAAARRQLWWKVAASLYSLLVSRPRRPFVHSAAFWNASRMSGLGMPSRMLCDPRAGCFLDSSPRIGRETEIHSRQRREMGEGGNNGPGEADLCTATQPVVGRRTSSSMPSLHHQPKPFFSPFLNPSNPRLPHDPRYAPFVHEGRSPRRQTTRLAYTYLRICPGFSAPFAATTYRILGLSANSSLLLDYHNFPDQPF